MHGDHLTHCQLRPPLKWPGAPRIRQGSGVTSEVQFVEGNDERTLVLEQSGGNTQVVVAEPAA